MLEARNDPDLRIIDEGTAARGQSPHRRDTPSFGSAPDGNFRPIVMKNPGNHLFEKQAEMAF
jgi:hypothetical protein